MKWELRYIFFPYSLPSTSFFEKKSLPLNCFGISVEKLLDHICLVYSWKLCLVPLIYFCLFFNQHHTDLMTVALLNFKSVSVISPHLFFIKIVLAILGTLNFHMYFRISLSVFIFKKVLEFGLGLHCIYR